MHSRVGSQASGGVMKSTRKCTAPNDRYHDEVTVMEASEYGLGNEGLGT